MRLSRAGIPTLLLVGNHDLSPALGRAHALDPFETFEVPNVHVIDRPSFLHPADLNDLPLQVIALPWVSRSGLMAHLGLSGTDSGQVFEELEKRLTELVQGWLEKADPSLPVVLTAHCSVQGARFGAERMVMLGSDLVLPGSLVKDPRLDYVALGHIHKPQDLNENMKPPVIYPGSIERVDFGEADDDKFFIIAHLERSNQRIQVDWRRLQGIRPFVDRYVRLTSGENVLDRLLSALPAAGQLDGCVLRLVLEYPRDWEALIDEAALREYTAPCFEFHLVKRPQVETRVRIPDQQSVGSLSPLELLEIYWKATHTPAEDTEPLRKLAQEVIDGTADR
jgi:exonuclease SbcD